MENSLKFTKLFIYINVLTFVHSQYMENLQCLSDLSLENLLKISKVIRKINETSSSSSSSSPTSTLTNSINLPLHESSNAYVLSDFGSNDVIKPLPLFNLGGSAAENVLQKRTEINSHGWHQEQKPSKIQKIFQVSVTSLAFLAFGGYLFCMIVQAIKSKGTTYFHPALMSTSPSTMEMLNGQSSYKRKKTGFRMKRNIKNNNNTTYANDNEDNIFVTQMDMYNILLLLAEGNMKLK